MFFSRVFNQILNWVVFYRAILASQPAFENKKNAQIGQNFEILSSLSPINLFMHAFRLLTS